MRCENFPYLLMIVVEPNQNASLQGEQGSAIGGVSTPSNVAIGSTYMRGVRYSNEGRVLLTLYKPIGSLFKFSNGFIRSFYCY